MKPMPDEQFDLLVDICKIQSSSDNEHFMFNYITKKLNRMKLKWSTDNWGNIFVTKGYTRGYYPTIVAHIDTVHNIVDDYCLYTFKNTLFAKSGDSLTGIGGDDKCGIYVNLYLLNTLPVLKAVFFSREEVGCVGSGKCDLGFFKQSAYILQADRQHGNDLIDTLWSDKTVSNKFSSAIGHVKKKYGFKSAKGSTTDCMKLFNRNINISCMNISSGYYEPHTAKEYIVTDELWNTALFIQETISTLGNNKYGHIPPVKTYTTNYTWRLCTKCKKYQPPTKFEYLSSKICTDCKPKEINGNKVSEAECCLCLTKLTVAKSLKWIDGKPYCPDCEDKASENNICTHCGKVLSVAEKCWINRKLYCNTCWLLPNEVLFPEKTECALCNELTDNKALRVLIDGETEMKVCDSCYNTYETEEGTNEDYLSLCNKCMNIAMSGEFPPHYGKFDICETCEYKPDETDICKKCFEVLNKTGVAPYAGTFYVWDKSICETCIKNTIGDNKDA